MTTLPDPLTPVADDQGLATAWGARLADVALTAWDHLIALAEAADLSQPARAHNWTGAQSLLPFGDWPENRLLPAILDDARAGRHGTVDQADDVRRALAAHSAVSGDESLDAVRRSRDSLVTWIADGGPLAEGLLPTRSLLGTLPVLTLVHATAFQMAVTGRDLQPCGAPSDESLTTTGLLALVDTTGALAARHGATASMTVRTPDVFLGTGATGGAWITVELDASSPLLGPGISASAADVIDIASGRVNVPSLYSSGAISVTDLPGLLALAPIIESVPGIPAGAALARAARLMSGVGGVLGALGGLFGRR